MVAHPGMPRNVVWGLMMTQQWLRTFDASGEEAGWLYSRLRDNNFLNREGSGSARAPTTQTG